MGLFNILGGGDDSNAQPQLIDPRQAGLLGFLAGMQKSGALDYTAPFLSGKVPSGFAAGLAGGAGGMLEGQQAATMNNLRAQLLGLQGQSLASQLAMRKAFADSNQKILSALPGILGGEQDAAGSPGAAIAGVQPQSTSAPQMGGGAADLTQPGEGEDPRGLVPYIRLTATKYGIDPDTAVAVARSEGLKTFLGDGGKSGGAFQLYTGGGLGNTFEKETGLNPLDPKNERATIDFALQQAAQGGWGPWHGAARIGIHGFDGIGRFAPPQGNSMLADSGAAPSFNTGPVTGLGQTPPAPIRLAQNGPLAAGLLTPSGGSAPLVRKNSIGETYISTDGGRDWQLAGPAASPNVAGGTRGAGDAPNGIDKTSGPVTPPIAPAAPQGLLAQAGPQAAPAPPGGLLGAQPPQMPQPTPAATPPGGQQINPAYIQWAQRMARIYTTLGRPVPPEIAEASKLPLVGPTAAATAGAQYPFEIGKQTNQANLQLRNKQLEPQIIRQGGSLWERNPATGQYELQAQSPRLPEGTSLVNTPQGPVAQEVPGAIGAIGAAAQAQKAGGYQAEYGGVPGFGAGANPAAAPTAKVEPIPTPQGTMLPAISEQFMPQSPAELAEALPKWHAQTEKWTEAIAPARQAEMRLQTIANAFKLTESGAFETHKAELATALKALGIDPGLVTSTNPAAVQEALHDNMLTTLPLLKAATPRPSQIEFLSVSENREHPNIQPAANLRMLSEDLALVRQAQQLPADWNVAQQMGWRNPQSFETAWSRLNPLDKAREHAEKDIGPLKGMPGGPGSPPPPSGAINALKMNPKLRDQFDAKYGPGSAAKVLGQ